MSNGITPQRKRKVLAHIKTFQDTFLSKACCIADRIECGHDISANDKRDFLKAKHQWMAADAIREEIEER